MAYVLSNRSKKRLAGVHPVLIEILEEGIENSPFDFGIPNDGGLRTTARQQELYAIGRTTRIGERKPVTYTDGIKKKSKHQPKDDGIGYAFDIYIYDNGKASWNVEKLSAVAIHLIKIAQKKNVLLVWGGSWNRFKDYPHFQLQAND